MKDEMTQVTNIFLNNRLVEFIINNPKGYVIFILGFSLALLILVFLRLPFINKKRGTI